jgi:pyridoxamine 5'-phosphate oxidase
MSDDGITHYPAMTSDGRPGWVPILEKEAKENESQNSGCLSVGLDSTSCPIQLITTDTVLSAYAFSTIGENNQPKVRFIIHRGLTSASSILLSTTDVRMSKASQLSADSSCEIAWWIENKAVQFRIHGNAYIVPNQDHVSDELEKCVNAIAGKGDEMDSNWWISERKRLWNNSMSGHLRASFARPTPGTPLIDHEAKPKDWPDTVPAEGEDVSYDGMGGPGAGETGPNVVLHES